MKTKKSFTEPPTRNEIMSALNAQVRTIQDSYKEQDGAVHCPRIQWDIQCLKAAVEIVYKSKKLQ